jgi:tetraacyldisaccharide 4'-kinase
MDHTAVHDILSGRRKGIVASTLRCGLAAASVGYGACMRARRWAYGQGVLPVRSARVPVISVGNLTTGGTGKTPMVAWLCRRLIERGFTPAVLSRGYGAQEPDQADEVAMLRERGVSVVVDADRVTGAQHAEAGGADVLVMDDGFQHRRLGRDLDIVLVDAVVPWGYGWCMPRGLLREPRTALRDADAVVVTRADEVEEPRREHLLAEVRRYAPRATLYTARHRPSRVIDAEGVSHGPGVLAGRKLCAFCGIAHPEAFFRTLRRLHARPVSEVALDDHADYARLGGAGLCGRCDAGEACQAEVMITTEKDYVKLPPGGLGRPVWRLAVEMEIDGGGEELLEPLAPPSRPAGQSPAPAGGD